MKGENDYKITKYNIYFFIFIETAICVTVSIKVRLGNGGNGIYSASLS